MHERYTTLGHVNQHIKEIDLGYTDDKNRPTQITRDALDRDDKLGQRGMYM